MHQMHQGQEQQMTYLTTRDLQDLIRVDKSTIYRMAEDGRLPAVKVGRQWRFPEAAVREMLGQIPRPEPSRSPDGSLIESLDPTATQAVADLAADALGAMVVITGMDGHPLSEVANPCGLFSAVAAKPDVVPKCVDTWARYGAVPDLTPVFRRSQFEFLCARSFIRVGKELLGMVIVGGVAPEIWPPDAAQIKAIAAGLGVATDLVAEHIDEVFYLDSSKQQRIVELLPGFAVVLSHMAENASQLVGRLDAIASLAGEGEDTRSAS
jgi:excisionase family DNA binding protein